MAPDSAILCKGEPRGASAMKDETNIGAAVTHNFIVSLADFLRLLAIKVHACIVETLTSSHVAAHREYRAFCNI